MTGLLVRWLTMSSAISMSWALIAIILPAHALAQTGATAGSALTLTLISGTREVRLSWQPGAVGSYTLTRFSAAGATLLPAPAPSASSATDVLPADIPWACYMLEASGAGRSNLLCAYPDIATGNATGSVSLRLALTRACPTTCIDPVADSAVVTWPPLPGSSGYLVMAVNSGSIQLLSGPSTTAVDFLADDIPNQPIHLSCYVLSVLGPNNQVQGTTGAVCGIPQISAQ